MRRGRLGSGCIEQAQMKLTYFSIRDYRSIAKAELENLQSAAILIGPNNEGKSNVLLGLNACLSLLRAPDLRRVDGKVESGRAEG